MYQIYTIAIDLANEYTRLCEEIISPGCTNLTFSKCVITYY